MKAIVPLFLALSAFVLSVSNQVFASSATWNLNPTSSDWNTAANWTPATVPNGPSDTATFDVSNTTNVAISAGTEVDSMVFNPDANAFTFNIASTLHVEGPILNRSDVPQSFVIGLPFNTYIQFDASSRAGKSTVYTVFGNPASDRLGAFVFFYDSASAEEATIIANGSAVKDTLGGDITFQESSTAAHSTLIAKRGAEGALGGGHIYFYATSIGDNARVELFGNGFLDIVSRYAPGITVGSIEGSGVIFLGSNNLTVGSNGLSTTFSGTIEGSGGSLTKTGRGKFIVSSANTYTGGTTVSKGTLLVTNTTGSATGTGPVNVNRGVLRGTGTISGAVTIGTATVAAMLAPGLPSNPSTLTLLSTLTFDALATYKVNLSSTNITADQVVAAGVTIDNGALISIDDLGSSVLASGTIFTIINNTSATPIAGTFSNLADASTLVVGSNTYKANYEGGTGNDLTLTVQ